MALASFVLLALASTAQANKYVPTAEWGLGKPGEVDFQTVLSIGTDQSGNVYVGDADGRVVKFSPTGGVIATWGGDGAGNGQFGDGPADIAVGVEGNVFVADPDNARIQKFAPDGGFLGKWGSAGSDPGKFHGPDHIAIDGDGNVYVGDVFNARVQRFTADGKFISSLGTKGLGPGQFEYSGGVAARGNTLYALDSTSERLQKFTLDGGLLGQWPVPREAHDLAVDPSGNVFVAKIASFSVRKFAPDGSELPISFGDLPGNSLSQTSWFPMDIAFDPAGNLFVADGSKDRILRFTPMPPATPPAPRITEGPKLETLDRTPTFKFEGDEEATFECSIDNGSWMACRSGQTFGGLPPGDHLFQVRQIVEGVTGPAAAYRWTVVIPRKCVLRTARARVFVFTKHRKVRLVIHYTSWRDARVNVSYELKGKRGGLDLGSAGSSFRKKGVFRLPVAMSRSAMARVRAATSYEVRFGIPGVSSKCTRYFRKKLTILRTIEKQSVWFQSDSLFAPPAG